MNIEQNVSSTDAENKDNLNSSKEELIKTEQIGETPFIMVSRENERFVTLGQHQLTDNLYEKEEKEVAKLIKKIKETDWEFLIAVIGAITTNIINRYQEEVKTELTKKLENEHN